MNPGEAPLLQLAEADDARRVFAWRNDPWIVSLSTSRREVSWEEHRRWFPTVLDRSRHLLFLVSGEGGEQAGTVRVDRQGEAAVVTIYLLRPFTGRGLGPRALRAACQEAFRRWPDLARVVAHVRSDNEPSLKAFARVGFAPAGGGEADCPEGHTALVLHRGGDVSSPDWTRDDESTVAYFTRLVERHGTDPRALDWGSRESQRLRFAVLAGVGPLGGASVLDVGCGQGDLLDWLRESGIDAQYAGVDITPPMVEVARRRFPGASFEVRNLLERPPEE